MQFYNAELDNLFKRVLFMDLAYFEIYEILKNKYNIYIYSKPKPAWQNYVADFANMLKAFIGSNYLTVSYAFLQSGLGVSYMKNVTKNKSVHLFLNTMYYTIFVLLIVDHKRYLCLDY